MAKSILITAALDIEIKPFVAFYKALRESDRFPAVYKAKYQGHTIFIGCLGVGKSFRKNLKKLDIPPIDVAILVGMAGGIKPDQKIGDFVFPETILPSATQAAPTKYHPSESLLYRMSGTQPQGVLLCANRVIHEKDKRELAEHIDFVDMESYFFCDKGFF